MSDGDRHSQNMEEERLKQFGIPFDSLSKQLVPPINQILEQVYHDPSQIDPNHVRYIIGQSTIYNLRQIIIQDLFLVHMDDETLLIYLDDKDIMNSLVKC